VDCWALDTLSLPSASSQLRWLNHSRAVGLPPLSVQSLARARQTLARLEAGLPKPRAPVAEPLLLPPLSSPLREAGSTGSSTPQGAVLPVPQSGTWPADPWLRLLLLSASDDPMAGGDIES
jgi:hypothetical protein